MTQMICDGDGDGVGVRTNQTLQTFPLHNSLFISTIGADKVESKVKTLTSSITNVEPETRDRLKLN